jgi:hypothetical protein
MQKNKMIPYIFLTILLILAIFGGGVQYGKSVENTNKKINAILSITPTPSPSPTQAPLTYKTYSHSGCGVEVLYPSNAQIENESTTSATLVYTDSNWLSLECDTKKIPADSSFTQTMTFQNKQLKYMPGTTNKDTSITFALTNIYTGKKVLFTVDKNYLPLLEKSLVFKVK